MGWSNYLIIPKWKIIIEIPRHVDELYEAKENALDWLIDHYYSDIESKKINELTIDDLSELYNVFDSARYLAESDSSEFLLYFLKKNNIEFEIKSEFDINLNQFKDYKIFR